MKKTCVSALNQEKINVYVKRINGTLGKWCIKEIVEKTKRYHEGEKYFFIAAERENSACIRKSPLTVYIF